MKKQYIFLLLISIILYIWYLIINFSYKEYKIASNIEYIKELNKNIKEKIEEAKKTIEYKSSLAYKNKILKEQQSYKNKGEEVIFITTQKEYNKYTQVKDEIIIEEDFQIIDSPTDNMSIYEKWMYLIFKKDT